MKTDDEKQLLLLKHQQKEAAGKAKGLADVFVDAAGRFAADWIGDTIASTVKREHEHTLTLSADAIKKMKAEVAAAQAVAPAATKKALANLPWEFRSDSPPDPNTYSSSYSHMALRSGKRPPDSIDKPLRKVLGEAGRILQTYDYPEMDDWGRSGGYRYPYGLDMSEDASVALTAAAEADTEYLRIRREVIALEKKIGETRAAAAWDDA